MPQQPFLTDVPGLPLVIEGRSPVRKHLRTPGFRGPGAESVQLQQDFLRQHPISYADIAQKPQEPESHADGDTDGGEDKRLDIARLTDTDQVIIEESRHECEPNTPKATAGT
jgi:hypothetical protein